MEVLKVEIIKKNIDFPIPTVYFYNIINFTNSNSSNNHRRHRSINKKPPNGYTTISASLAACFQRGGRKQSISSHKSPQIFKHLRPASSIHATSSQDFPSSILESQSSGYSIVTQRRPIDNSFKEVSPVFEETPRSFCKITQLTTICPPSRYKQTREVKVPLLKSAVVEVECQPSRSHSPSVSSWDEVLSDEWSYTGLLAAGSKFGRSGNRDSRSILKKELVGKSVSNSRITFAMDQTQVSSFQYPGHEYFIEESNDNNHCKNDDKTELILNLSIKLLQELQINLLSTYSNSVE